MSSSWPHVLWPLYISRQVVAISIISMMIIVVCIIAINGHDIVRKFWFSRIFLIEIRSLVIRKFDFVCSGSPISWKFPFVHVDSRNRVTKGRVCKTSHLNDQEIFSNERLRGEVLHSPSKGSKLTCLSKSWSFLWGWRKPGSNVYERISPKKPGGQICEDGPVFPWGKGYTVTSGEGCQWGQT